MLQELETIIIGTGEVKGFVFTQISKSEQAYMYEVQSEEGKLHYEVFKRLNSHVCLDFKNHIYSETEFKENYPKANSFGLTAWTCRTKDLAEKRFKDL